VTDGISHPTPVTILWALTREGVNVSDDQWHNAMERAKEEQAAFDARQAKQAALARANAAWIWEDS
jgi:hypothetical protein